MLDDVIWIWRAVRIVGLDLSAGQCDGADNGGADKACTQRDLYTFAHGDSLPKIFGAVLRQLNTNVRFFAEGRKRPAAQAPELSRHIGP
jgi:hypothetical protein